LSTRTALLKTAREVFSEAGFYGTSVAEIGRRCGVSQGTFYQYFKNKEQIFLELNDRIVDRFWAKAEALDRDKAGAGFQARFRAAVDLLLEHTKANFFFHRILGEFELIDPVTIGYYDSLARYFRGFLRRAANGGHIRPLDPNVIAYALIGMAYFQSLDWGPGAETFSREELTDLVVDLAGRGINGSKGWRRPADLALSAFNPEGGEQLQWQETRTQGEKTRLALFQAAERVIGQNGYNRANISEITRLAGVAQGTFYIHFKSKQELMRGVVEYLSREMRWHLRRATDKVADRRDKEREGILAFFRFLGHHRRIYRVVAESETVGREVAMWYYTKLAQGYAESLAEGLARGEIRPLPVAFLVRALMGLNHMIGLKWLVWNSSPKVEIPTQVLADTVDLVLLGINAG